MSRNDKSTSTMKNLFWRFAERCGAQGVGFIVSIILARLLAPEVYGTLALVVVFTSILSVFINSGMGIALVQKKDADDLDFSTLFYFNIFMCLFLYVLLYISAPFISNFYGIPELTKVLRVMGLNLLFFGVGNIQNSYVSKNLIFKKFFFSTIGSTIGSAIVGISLAYSGFGVWALVFQGLTSNFLNVLILWFTVEWRPKRIFSFVRLKGLFSYGWKLLASSLLDTLYKDIRQLIIGKLYSSSDLAFYNKGDSFPNLIVTNINTSIDSVLLPTMSEAQDSRQTVKAMTRRAIKTSTYLMAPLMVGLAVCAEPVIKLLLTDKWLPCVLFLRIFCISYLFLPMHTANLNAIKAIGRSDLFLKLEIIKKIVGLILLFSTIWISVEAMAYSLLFSTFFGIIINAYPNKKLLDYSWAEQMKDILPCIGLALLMGIPVLLLALLPLPQIAILAIQVITGAIIYIGISWILKLETFNYLIGILKGFLKKS